MPNENEGHAAPHPSVDSQVIKAKTDRASGGISLRTCANCRCAFVPSSRHLRCSSCRRQASHDLCACGSPKQHESSTCRGCQPTRGELNGSWRGGRTTHKAGYVMRRVPGHPRASVRSPYVFEHILHNRREFAHAMPWPGPMRSSTGTTDFRTAPTTLTLSTERSWSWGESNPSARVCVGARQRLSPLLTIGFRLSSSDRQ